MYDREKMRADIQRTIEEADFDFECSGTQTENDSDLTLEKITLDDPDAVINEILGIVSDYIAEML